MAIKVFVNGKEETLMENTSIEKFLTDKGFRKEVVVVELNGVIIEKDAYAKTIIKSGDKLEFIFYMGGGTSEPNIDEKIDLRNELCPLNYVKTKLKLEEMENSQVLEVLLSEGEAIRNVTKSIINDGHEIIRIEKKDGYFSLVIKKKV